MKRPRECPWKNNETDFFSLIDAEFKREIMKTLEKLRKAMDRNTGYCKKGTKNYKEEQKRNSFAKMKADLKTINSRMNNEEV